MRTRGSRGKNGHGWDGAVVASIGKTRASMGKNATVVAAFDGASFTIGAEAANVINAAIQLTRNGVAIVENAHVFAYLSDDSDGDGVSTSAPNGSEVIGTNGAIVREAASAGLSWDLLTDGSGRVDLDLTHSASRTWYLVVTLPSGLIVVSEALAWT